MFSGIVETVGTIRSLDRSPESVSLRVRSTEVLDDLDLGHSVSVDGVCLTVTELFPDGFRVGLSPETLRRTSLGSRVAGDPINLERALKVGARMGGHYVQGHVDDVCTMLSRTREGDSDLVSFSGPADLMPYVVMKGYIALDGISLTVAQRGEDSFGIALIAYTRNATSLGSKAVGSVVNLEVDVIAKYVESLLANRFERAS